MSEYVLAEEIKARSNAKTWDRAKLEWKLARIYNEPNNQCLCGHNPITEVCVLENRVNGNVVEVGNCCVEKFMDISSNKLFEAIKRVTKDIGKPFNAEVIQLEFEQRHISTRDRDFYLDTIRKRKLTPKQLLYREAINRKILRNYRDFQK